MLLAGLAWGIPSGDATKLVDVLDSPVAPAPPGSPGAARAARGLVTGIAQQANGGRLVAVGPRGLILLSDDRGAHWRQAPCPVAADLVNVKFSPDSTVWAVGHDGVILRSQDAGEQWARVLDGRMLATLLKAAYPASTSDAMAREIEQGLSQSATPGVWPAPFLDIAFTDATHGFAVGAFGLIVRTEDGGKTWQPWIAHVRNDKRYHLYAIATGEGGTYLAGEQGLLLRLNPAGDSFEPLTTPYNGSFFGVDVLDEERLLVYGLRGNAYLSVDGGGHWQRLETATDANIIGGTQSSERITLVSQNGEVMVFAVPGGAVQKVFATPGPEMFAAVPVAPNRMAVARLTGPTVLEWSANQ